MQVADTLLQQMDIERFVAENLNEHRKGILGKTVPVGNMLTWTKVQKIVIYLLSFLCFLKPFMCSWKI